MRIAVFDYWTCPINGIGGCNRRMLHALSSEHDFVVFAGAFDNPNPERIRFVRIPVIARPLAALFISYHFMARLVYWWYQLRNGVTFDVVQTNGTNFSIGDVAYAHFCHRAYLRDHWRAEGARSSVHRFMRYCDHRLHSAMESVVFRRAQKIVVPSHGLRRELESIYPASRGKITVISNAIDVESMRPPADHQRSLLRASLSYPPGRIVLAFTAAGAFERKGMDVLLAAFAQVRCDDLHLVVLGGGAQVIAPWRKRAEMMGLARSVTFVGVQPDPRPFYWAADGFVFPSRYEVFSMVCLEAAAAQLPLLATRINGTEEFLEDGRNGLVLLPEVDSVASSLDRFRQMSREDRERMGIEARRSVMQFSLANFESAWRSFYAHTPRDASVGGLRSGLGGTGSSNEAARHIVEE